MSSGSLVDLVPRELRAWWTEIGIYPNADVFSLFRRRAAEAGDRAAVIDEWGTHTYAEVEQTARRIAAGLVRLGVERGQVVASQLPNSMLACAVELATAAIGAITLPFPPGRGYADILSLLRRSEAPVIVTLDEFGPARPADVICSLRGELDRLQHVVVLGQAREETVPMASLLAETPIDPADLPEIDPDAAVRYLVSSGTEAGPKMVAYSHNALIGGRGQFLGRLGRPGVPIRLLFLVPLGSAFGSSCTFGLLSALGGSLVVLPRFDADDVLRVIARHRPTHIAGVPTMFQRLLASPLVGEVDTTSLEVLISGGSTVDPATVERCIATFGGTFVNLYGSADGVNCHTLPGDPADAVKHTVGTPNPAVCAIRVVGQDGKPMVRGETGEVHALGPMSPMCYVAAPGLNELYRTADGWVRTGDLGSIDDDGRLRLAGRARELIVRGGGNISPVEVERAVAAHPAVLSVACVPVPDDDLGQRVCVMIVPVPGQVPPVRDELSAFLARSGLEPRKHPEFVLVVDRMPLTPAGKVDKHELTRQAAETVANCHVAEPVPGWRG